jgi:hypothetical protein
MVLAHELISLILLRDLDFVHGFASTVGVLERDRLSLSSVGTWVKRS